MSLDVDWQESWLVENVLREGVNHKLAKAESLRMQFHLSPLLVISFSQPTSQLQFILILKVWKSLKEIEVLI